MSIDLTHPPLPDDKIRALVRQYRAGDMDAANLIIQHNDRLVYKIAMRYYSARVTGETSIDDLMQWGRVGLWRALSDFKLESANNFSTYAYYWVRLYVSRYGKRQGNDLALSFQASERRGKVGQARADFEQTNHREPSAAELAAVTGLTPEYIASLRTDIVSLDDDCNDSHRAESIPDTGVNVEDEASDRADLVYNRRIRDHLDKLPENWRLVITARYGLDGNPPCTMQVIGKRMGISKERVRQIEVAALTKLREIIDFF